MRVYVFVCENDGGEGVKQEEPEKAAMHTSGEGLDGRRWHAGNVVFQGCVPLSAVRASLHARLASHGQMEAKATPEKLFTMQLYQASVVCSAGSTEHCHSPLMSSKVPYFPSLKPGFAAF